MLNTPTTAPPAQLAPLITIMDELRTKCPWDKKQTIETLRPLTIEETYELADAILRNDMQGVKEELGDLLLHIVFYAKIGAEQQAFTLQEVIDSVCAKLVHRHPHIYGNEIVENEEDVKRNWERLKMKEKGKTSVLGGVPVGLPAVVKALRIQEKAKKIGFEWENKADVWAKVQEEMTELLEAENEGKIERVEEEFGDLLFSLVNYARFLNIDPELALERTNRKFTSRFMKMEELALSRNSNLAEMTLDEMDAVWNEVKILMQQ